MIGALAPYYGGKWRMSTWILEHVPPHRAWIEPFGGLANVLLRKPRSFCEVYNDTNDLVVNLFNVLRDRPSCAQLVEMLELTPYSRKDYEHAWYTRREGTPVERAYKFLVYANSSFGSAMTSDRTSLSGWDNRIFSGGKKDVNKDKAKTFMRLPEKVVAASLRLKGVAIEHRDFTQILDNYGAKAVARVCFYCDPPYLGVLGYPDCPFNETHHEILLKRLVKMDDMILISGYDSDLYKDYLKDWTLVTNTNNDLVNNKKTECLWLNPYAKDELDRHGSIFRTISHTTSGTTALPNCL